MSALPQARPDVSKKPTKTARKLTEPSKCSPRTPQQISADFRSRTNYAKGTGYFPIFHALWEDILRLSSGLACTNLIGTVIQDLSIRSSGTHALPEDAELSIPELASRIRCDERQVNRVLEYLQSRGMAIVARLANSRFVITLTYQTWGDIEESYEQWDAKRRAAEEAQNPAEEVNQEEEAIPVKEGTVVLTKHPVQVKTGERSRPIKVNTGIRSLRIHWESKVLDLRFSAVVTSGELVLTGDVPNAETLKSKRDAKSTDSTRSNHTSGHGP